MRLRVALVIGLGVLASGRAARASAADVLGLGSEESGVGGASAARVDDFSSGFYDPAGLVGLKRSELTVGVLGFGARLTIKDPSGTTQKGMTDPVGIVVGAATPVPFVGALRDRIYFGLALYILPAGIVRIIAHEPDQAFYPLYDNRTQRLIVLPSLAVRLGRGLSVGLAVNYLAGLDGRVSAAEGATRAVEGRVDEQIVAQAAVNVGVRWQPVAAWSFALVYRQQFSVPFNTISSNTVAGQPIDVNVDAEELFTPHTVVGGVAWRVRHFVASLDVAWARWSDWRGPYVTVDGALPLVGAIHAEPPHPAFKDTGAVRAGLEWDHAFRRFDTAVRAGYGFESSPVPQNQLGESKLLDGNKHRLALGFGVGAPLGPVELRVDAHAQVEIVQAMTVDGTLSGGGFVWAAGLTATVAK